MSASHIVSPWDTLLLWTPSAMKENSPCCCVDNGNKMIEGKIKKVMLCLRLSMSTNRQLFLTLLNASWAPAKVPVRKNVLELYTVCCFSYFLCYLLLLVASCYFLLLLGCVLFGVISSSLFWKISLLLIVQEACNCCVPVSLPISPT